MPNNAQMQTLNNKFPIIQNVQLGYPIVILMVKIIAQMVIALLIMELNSIVNKLQLQRIMVL